MSQVIKVTDITNRHIEEYLRSIGVANGSVNALMSVMSSGSRPLVVYISEERVKATQKFIDEREGFVKDMTAALPRYIVAHIQKSIDAPYSQDDIDSYERLVELLAPRPINLFLDSLMLVCARSSKLIIKNGPMHPSVLLEVGHPLAVDVSDMINIVTKRDSKYPYRFFTETDTDIDLKSVTLLASHLDETLRKSNKFSISVEQYAPASYRWTISKCA